MTDFFCKNVTYITLYMGVVCVFLFKVYYYDKIGLLHQRNDVASTSVYIDSYTLIYLKIV